MVQGEPGAGEEETKKEDGHQARYDGHALCLVDRKGQCFVAE